MKLTYKHTVDACYLGYITQAAVVNLSPILFIVFQNQFGISYEMIGRLILINFCTQLLTDVVAVRYIDRVGIRPAAVFGHAAVTLGFILMAVLPQVMTSPYAGLVIAVVIYAIGGGLIEVLVSPTVDALPGEAKDSAMSLLHSFYSWGQVAVMLLSTLFIRAFGANLWYLLPLLWAIVPTFNAVLFARVPLAPAIPHHEKTPLKRLFTSRIFILAMVLMMCAGASEQAIAQWSSLFAEKGLGIPKLVGDLLGPVLFAVFMGVGRMTYGIWGERINLKATLIASSVLCIACYLVTVLAPVLLVALAGVALSGFTVSMMWPGMLRLTSRTFPLGSTAMFGVLAIMGDLGCALGPWIAGVVSDVGRRSTALLQIGAAGGMSADQIGLRAGILAAIIFPIGMLVGVLLFKKHNNGPSVDLHNLSAQEPAEAH
ncbi:MAG: MFS transporter [Anaerolineae bacterium]